jgi:type I restriction enzyme S subunit
MNMHYWFSFFQKILDEQAPQVAQKNINLKILSELNVTVPNQDEQMQFAAFVAQVDKSKTVVQKALDDTQLLFDSLMQQCFG